MLPGILSKKKIIKDITEENFPALKKFFEYFLNFWSSKIKKNNPKPRYLKFF